MSQFTHYTTPFTSDQKLTTYFNDILILSNYEIYLDFCFVISYLPPEPISFFNLIGGSPFETPPILIHNYIFYFSHTFYFMPQK